MKEKEYLSKISELTDPKLPEVSEEILRAIKNRIEEFEKLGKNGRTTFDFKPFLDLELEATVETELAFCISTANSSAKAGLRFQKLLEGKELSKLEAKEIEELLRRAGVRFCKKKAIYIENAIKKFQRLQILEEDARDLLVKEFYGLGFKEASHFLRNIGRKDFAILDRHILRWLGISYPSLTRKRYLEVENRMREIALKNKISVAELDLLVWFSKTKMVLK
ncbi:MAG: N-glycosylase/DNA lyase [Archaeoglobaceae archaeon]|nr:N-glycosylase/DNA lyase [Archaeoglobaceae archaeon]MDW8127612.1 N-glycosylase/DNA lyase [Archaeoglobaceae archaeon]